MSTTVTRALDWFCINCAHCNWAGAPLCRNLGCLRLRPRNPPRVYHVVHTPSSNSSTDQGTAAPDTRTSSHPDWNPLIRQVILKDLHGGAAGGLKRRKPRILNTPLDGRLPQQVAPHEPPLERAPSPVREKEVLLQIRRITLAKSRTGPQARVQETISAAKFRFFNTNWPTRCLYSMERYGLEPEFPVPQYIPMKTPAADGSPLTLPANALIPMPTPGFPPSFNVTLNPFTLSGYEHCTSFTPTELLVKPPVMRIQLATVELGITTGNNLRTIVVTIECDSLGDHDQIFDFKEPLHSPPPSPPPSCSRRQRSPAGKRGVLMTLPSTPPSPNRPRKGERSRSPGPASALSRRKMTPTPPLAGASLPTARKSCYEHCANRLAWNFLQDRFLVTAATIRRDFIKRPSRRTSLTTFVIPSIQSAMEALQQPDLQPCSHCVSVSAQLMLAMEIYEH